MMMKTMLLVALTLISLLQLLPPGQVLCQDVDENLRQRYEMMRIEWFNTDKYPPINTSREEDTYFHSCDRFKKEYPPQDDDYYQLPPDFEPKARLSSGVSQRCDFRQVSRAEFRRYKRALDAMQGSVITRNSEYQVFCAQHNSGTSPSAHFSPAFLCWHREFLQRLETALQRHDPSVTLLYCDTRLDFDLPNFCDSVIFAPDYYGTPYGNLDGQWANWVSTVPGCSRAISRQCTNNKNYLYSDNLLNYLLSNYAYPNWCYPRNTDFEIWHGGPHNAMGGTLAIIPCAAADPFFFAHHTCIDYYWQIARDRQANNVAKTSDYPNWGNIPSGNRANDNCLPFQGMRNIQGMSTRYDQAITYRHARISCSRDADCSDDGAAGALWCNRNTGRCTSKVKPGGNCGSFPDNACYRDSTCRYQPTCRSFGNVRRCDCGI